MPSQEEIKIAMRIPLKECGEPLVDLRNYNKDIIVRLEETSKKAQGLKTDKCFLREGTAIRLSLAQSLLPTGYRFKVIDGYRPLKAQRSIFKHLMKVLAKRHPEMSKKQVLIETEKWVSPPDKIVPPHTTGGTVDLTIVNKKGKELDMGTPVNKVDKRSYSNSKDISATAKRNRKMLKATLGKAGFVNDPWEWWHWSYGDWRWASAKKRASIYKSI